MALSPALARHPAAVWTSALLFVALPVGVPSFHRRPGVRLAALAWALSLALSLVSTYFVHSAVLHGIGPIWLHASPGTGFWGPPNRILVPPGFTLLTPRPGPPASGR